MLILNSASHDLLFLGARLEKYTTCAQSVLDGLYDLQREEYCYISNVNTFSVSFIGQSLPKSAATDKLKQELTNGYTMLASKDIAAVCAYTDEVLATAQVPNIATTCSILPSAGRREFVVVACTISPLKVTFTCAKCQVC